MVASWNTGTLIHLNGIFHYKPTNLENPIYEKTLISIGISSKISPQCLKQSFGPHQRRPLSCTTGTSVTVDVRHSEMCGPDQRPWSVWKWGNQFEVKSWLCTLRPQVIKHEWWFNTMVGSKIFYPNINTTFDGNIFPLRHPLLLFCYFVLSTWTHIFCWWSLNSCRSSPPFCLIFLAKSHASCWENNMFYR